LEAGFKLIANSYKLEKRGLTNKEMYIFKFGGASVSTIDRIKNVAEILRFQADKKLLVVISAMGKTTNALEKVADAFFNGNKEEALLLFNEIKEQHLKISADLAALTGKDQNGIQSKLNDFFTEVEWLLHDKPVRDYDYYYDQIVCIGELLSTATVSQYLNDNNVQNQWIDVRDVIRTDNNFRDAKIDWEITEEKTNSLIRPLFEKTNIVLTQGFIGATEENESTTLGREGSDYTAAVFANLLDAESQTIWKDVQGVMNADPRQYDKAKWIEELNYREVIEMAYYGAQVIHPKTIKPLENKNIPLIVKSFINPEEKGTVIHNKNLSDLPPIIVHKHNQVLMELNSKDFSFVGEGLTSELYRIFASIKFRPNLTQNAAISLLCVVDDHAEKVDQLAHAASGYFDVRVKKDLKLITIRHYNEDVVKELCRDCEVILRQQTQETIQLLLQRS
jgi:aspartate kinase